jgi:hypothetical protein
VRSEGKAFAFFAFNARRKAPGYAEAKPTCLREAEAASIRQRQGEGG